MPSPGMHIVSSWQPHDRLEFAHPIPRLAIAFIELVERFSYYGTTVVFTNFIQQPLPEGSRTGAGGGDGQSGALGRGQQASTGKSAPIRSELLAHANCSKDSLHSTRSGEFHSFLGCLRMYDRFQGLSYPSFRCLCCRYLLGPVQDD